jgi:membrane-associated phospholipid phosphatase
MTTRLGIRRLEILLLAFQGAFVVALLGVWAQPQAPRGLLIHLIGTMAMLVLCRSFSPKDPFVRGFCEWGYLYPFIGISYFATGKLTPLYWNIGQAHDALLAQVDGALFGVTPGLWKTGINHPFIVEVCAYGYVSYFLFGILLVGSLYHRYNASTRVFALIFTAVVTAFYLSYLGYWIFPAQGPRYIWKEFLEPLKGYALANYAFNSMDDVSLGFYDAFPSEHTMFSIIAAVIWWRYNRKMFWVMLPFLSLAVAATVILRYHWVTDVVVGAALAPLVLWISDRWGLWLASPPPHRK